MRDDIKVITWVRTLLCLAFAFYLLPKFWSIEGRRRSAAPHSAEYARALSEDPIEGFAFFEESIEHSRPFRALSLCLSLRYYGLRAFQECIWQDLRLGRLLADMIDSEPRLQRLAPVALSAVYFRYVGGSGDLDSLNRGMLDRVIRRGRVSNAFLDCARLRGGQASCVFWRESQYTIAYLCEIPPSPSSCSLEVSRAATLVFFVIPTGGSSSGWKQGSGPAPEVPRRQKCCLSRKRR